MKWLVSTDRDFKLLFGESLHTVFRGVHVVMTWDTDQYVVRESMTRKVIAAARRKGEVYKQMKEN